MIRNVLQLKIVIAIDCTLISVKKLEQNIMTPAALLFWHDHYRAADTVLIITMLGCFSARGQYSAASMVPDITALNSESG